MAVFLPVVQNWEPGVRDTYSFRTDIFTSDDGSEQRTSHYFRPRRVLQVSALLDGDRHRRFADALNRARDGRVEITDFAAEQALVATAAPAGSDAFWVATPRPAWLVTGSDAALIVGRRAYKVRVLTLSGVGGGFVTLEDPLPVSVGPGTILLPTTVAAIAPSTQLTSVTARDAVADLEFRVEPGTPQRAVEPFPFDEDGPATQIIGNAGMFYGRYVLLRRPNYLRAPLITHEIPYQQVDYGRGIVKPFVHVPITARTLTATWTGLSRQLTMELLDVFLRAKGRSGEIYVPTWGDDFPPVVSVSGANITFAGSDFFASYFEDRAHEAILLRTTAGDLMPFQVQSMNVTGGGNTQVTFDTSIGVSAASIAQVSWMFVARFAQDTLTIEWLTDAVANVVMSFVTLEHLPVESLFSNWILATGQWRDLGQWEDTNVWIDF